MPISRICQQCGKNFSLPPSWIKDGRGKFCSRACRFGKSIVTRFWEKVQKTDTCWLWKGTLDPTGYGTISIHCRPVRAHRLSWQINNGPIPKGMNILHKCDNPRCVRLDHLFLGTRADNAHDRTMKDRQAKGSRNGKAKLNEQDIIRIREDSRTQKEIGREYGVSSHTIWMIKARKNWRHI